MSMPHFSRPLWTKKEIKTLISIWSDKDVKRSLKSSRNSHVYEFIANRMQTLGYNRTATQCRLKMKNLKAEYKASKNNHPKFLNHVYKYSDLLETVLGSNDHCLNIYDSDLNISNLNMPNDSQDEEGSNSDNFENNAVELHSLDLTVKEQSRHSDTKRSYEEKDETHQSNVNHFAEAIKDVTESVIQKFICYQEAREHRLYSFQRDLMQHEADMERMRLEFFRKENERQIAEERNRELRIIQLLENIFELDGNTKNSNHTLNHSKP